MYTLGNPNLTNYNEEMQTNYACGTGIHNTTGWDILISSMTFFISDANNGCKFKPAIWDYWLIDDNTGYEYGPSETRSLLAVGDEVELISGNYGQEIYNYYLTSNISFTMLNNTLYLVGFLTSSGSGVFATSGGIYPWERKNLYRDYSVGQSYDTPTDFTWSSETAPGWGCIYLTYTLSPKGIAPSKIGDTVPTLTEGFLFANIRGIY